MTALNEIPPGTFAYLAQTFDGRSMSGTIDATTLDDAAKRLSDLRLRVIQLDPAQRPARAKPLTGEDFASFNQQLAHLSAAGLPIEQGLRLIAEDLQQPGLAQSVRDVSAELDRGVSLGDAFKRHEQQFPPLYGALIDAGVRANNLPAVLLNLGRHLELVARLRASLWRAVAYPLTVFLGLLVVLIFLGRFVLPQFIDLYKKWPAQVPAVTRLLFGLVDFTPGILVASIALVFGIPLFWILLRAIRLDRAAADVALRLPMVGPVMKRNLIARWCDAMKLGVQSGMDLPAAVQLACDVVASPALARDGAKMISQLRAGKEVDQMESPTSVLPATALAVVQLSADRNELPSSLDTLSRMYQQQAEMRLASLQTILAPVLIIGVALLVGIVILGLFAPMVSLFKLFS